MKNITLKCSRMTLTFPNEERFEQYRGKTIDVSYYYHHDLGLKIQDSTHPKRPELHGAARDYAEKHMPLYV